MVITFARTQEKGKAPRVAWGREATALIRFSHKFWMKGERKEKDVMGANADGDWLMKSKREACGPGSYKPLHGAGECQICPTHSWSNRSASVECECDSGYHRAKGSGFTAPCTKIADGTYDHLSGIQSTVSDDDMDFTDGRSQGEMPSQSDDSWLSNLTSLSTWPWLLVCFVVIMSLCILLLMVSRQQNITGRKQMSDLDVLDNYKQDTISPDYSRSLTGLKGSGGGIGIISCFGGQNNNSNTLSRRKTHSPLIRAGQAFCGTHHRNIGGAAVVVTSVNGRLQQQSRNTMNRQQHNRMYVDPTTYENPSDVLAQFTNEICPENIELTRVIGSGEFGEVCCGRLTVEDQYGQKQQQIVAIKSLHAGVSAKAKADFLMEASIMGQFEHENVIHLIGVVTRSEPVMILTEYMLYGSLDQFLRSNNSLKLTICQLLKLLHGIAAGMKYLNDKGYVHRDLAARNVLVDDRLTCKIADFGLSRGMKKCGSSLGHGSSFEQIGEYTTHQGGKIPIRWTAPEAIMQNKYTIASDVWSFGVVMWEVLSYGERPYWDWTNHRVIQEVVHAGYRLPAPQDTPKRLYEMMLSCWHSERNKRPTFGDLLEQLNAFLSNVDFFYKYV